VFVDGKLPLIELMEKSLPVINEMLAAGCSPIGAYCLGAVCSLAWSAGCEPSRRLLEAATECSSVEEVTELYQDMERMETLTRCAGQ
jgi:hypothetical protein